MSSPSIKLSTPVKVPLSVETDDDEENEGDESQDTSENETEEDKYFIIENDDNGKVDLNKETPDGKTNLYWILESEKGESGNRKNILYRDISNELFRYFFVDQGSTKKVSVLTKLMSISDNNFNSDAANQYLDVIFSNSKLDYHSPTYTNNRGSMVEELRRLDGRFDKSWFYDSID
jgi:hypothetical protein